MGPTGVLFRLVWEKRKALEAGGGMVGFGGIWWDGGGEPKYPAPGLFLLIWAFFAGVLQYEETGLQS